ncbi:sporulation initiation phosphotransferase B [Thermaerobacillus caldiproteolyticus]|uniref:Stage 0 sporulation protein B (Sporulation initiation phosphotransferase) n=1 Tax=Thermaerobacillus caldiproteolyticus TaxID=247480 RepID=A0A7V9Z430_9BACL|nr:sporulation initiation phosphotransferase B [Anoxybacillus caldiproteolyticus]MBA2873646.1 stage 0 sporulation protein B (sporulation initiation phosphotransferase) [Anoxybacillus caldiproteolyticus]QPA30220.1 sporulation initiation phosphotransferase B [Anoxybacillus caldiproteolyticus]
MEKQWSILDVLRHSRHDWLNKIQLIKGNLALNKVERVNDIIEEIVRDMQHETKLTNLKAARFAEMLMTYNWEARCVVLEYEVIGDECDLSSHDAELTQWCRSFFAVIEQQADINRENYLEISIEVAKREIRLFFDYNGTIKNMNAVKEWLEEHKKGIAIHIDHFHIHNEEMTVLIKIDL